MIDQNLLCDVMLLRDATAVNVGQRHSMIRDITGNTAIHARFISTQI